MAPDYTAASPDHEIVSIRMIKAAQDLVYKAWTDPLHLAKWWGPAGFTNTFHEFDLRPGGKWLFTMHGPDKGHYNNECEFTIVEKPALLAWKRYSQPLFQVVVRFEAPTPGQTKIIYRMIFDSVEACNKIKHFAGDKNEENFDRLEQEISIMSAAKAKT